MSHKMHPYGMPAHIWSDEYAAKSDQAGCQDSKIKRQLRRFHKKLARRNGKNEIAEQVED